MFKTKPLCMLVSYVKNSLFLQVTPRRFDVPATKCRLTMEKARQGYHLIVHVASEIQPKKGRFAEYWRIYIEDPETGVKTLSELFGLKVISKEAGKKMKTNIHTLINHINKMRGHSWPRPPEKCLTDIPQGDYPVCYPLTGNLADPNEDLYIVRYFNHCRSSAWNPMSKTRRHLLRADCSISWSTAKEAT